MSKKGCFNVSTETEEQSIETTSFLRPEIKNSGSKETVQIPTLEEPLEQSHRRHDLYITEDLWYDK